VDDAYSIKKLTANNRRCLPVEIAWKQFQGDSNTENFVLSTKARTFRYDGRNSDRCGGIVLGFSPHLDNAGDRLRPRWRHFGLAVAVLSRHHPGMARMAIQAS
jgi:hypothetical protein